MAARVIGVLFLAAMLTYGPGSGLVAAVLDSPDALAAVSTHTTQFTLGAVLMLVNSLVVVAIGVVLLPTLRRHSERIAFGYLSARVVEAVLLSLGVLSLLSLVPASEAYVVAGASGDPSLATDSALAVAGNDMAYQVAMAALGVGSLFLCALLYRRRLVPRILAGWGFVGYAVFLTGAVLEILGIGVGLLLSIPGGLFEVFFGVWLIVRGFDPR